MDRRIEEDVEGWPTRPIDGGYDGLRQLAAADFSGAVQARGATMFMLNGRIVGVFDGTVDDFEDASGTAHKAPHRGLPLLYTMQATGGETQGKYYTEDTPISEVDGTLSEGNFTGFLELSENVLSGDYYLVYHAGRSMSLAFIGNSGRLVTGEEAYGRADDEVGIYEVVDVDVEVRDVPGVGEDDAAGDADDAGAAESTDPESDEQPADAGGAAEADAESSQDGEQAGDAATTDAGSTPDEESTAPESSPADGERDADSGSGPHDEGQPPGEEPPVAEERPAAGDAVADAGAAGGADAAAAGAEQPASGGGAGASGGGAGASGGGGEAAREEAAAGSGAPAGAGAPGGGAEGVAKPTSDRATIAEATTIPSLDPDRTGDLEQLAQHPETIAGERPSRDRADVDDALDQEVLEREDRIDRLEQRASNLRAERDELATERDRLAQQVQELQAEKQQLEHRLQRIEERIDGESSAADDGAASSGGDDAAGASADGAPGGAGGGAGGPATLSSRDALQGTDCFVRYDSKGQPTLEDVPDGAETAAVNDNLRLDLHTRFDADSATVDGQPYREFLEDTMSYRFVDWLVRTLPYEIRETGQAAAMRDCYDAIPEADRVEFDGVVELTYEEEGELVEAEESFDVVVRDRMGDPLFVADMNDSRDPANAGMLLDLQAGATRVKESDTTLAGAFAVTRSFFDPEALETAAEATSGSLLSRDSRRSYVRVGRKQGYHLCLVEAREGNLHLNVPEL